MLPKLHNLSARGPVHEYFMFGQCGLQTFRGFEVRPLEEFLLPHALEGFVFILERLELTPQRVATLIQPDIAEHDRHTHDNDSRDGNTNEIGVMFFSFSVAPSHKGSPSGHRSTTLSFADLARGFRVTSSGPA